MQYLIHILRGVAIGLANIIPGVSGGTMALLLGIYQRLITAIGHLGPRTLLAPFKGKAALIEEARRVDLLFLASLGVGAGAAIVAVARLMTWLLAEQHDPTYGFFFGLVLASVAVPYGMIRRKSPSVVIFCLLAALLVVGLSLAMSGDQILANAQHKAEIKAAAASLSGYTVSADPRTMLVFFAGGVIAISAMILPGISGSFMLLLMGLYFDVLSCITERNLPMVAVFAAGCGVGLLAFTRFLKWLIERQHDNTMGFLTGLVLGSLWAIWPFKRFELVAGHRVDLDNVLPATLGSNEALTLLALIAGAGLVVAFMVVERKLDAARKG
jgi:putative membrane protein